MAEYNALNREIIGELLTDLEIEVDLAKNGALAVEKVKKCRQALTSGFVHDIALSYIG